ncbi:MAG: hypothetical protein ACXVRP_06985 [Solirubrobacteraceae bacterium]
MDAWSVKSVPGCLVLIVPRLMGVPVAVTPGLGPQDDVSTLPEPPALPLVAPDALDVAPLLPPLDAELAPPLLLELLLPHAARATNATVRIAASRIRRRGTTSPRLMLLLLLGVDVLFVEPGPGSCSRDCVQSRSRDRCESAAARIGA